MLGDGGWNGQRNVKEEGLTKYQELNHNRL